MYELETRTNIEQLYSERIERFNKALIERMNDIHKVKDLENQVNELNNLLKQSQSRYFNMNQQNKLLRKKEIDKTIDKVELKTLILDKIEELKRDRYKNKKLTNFIKKLFRS